MTYTDAHIHLYDCRNVSSGVPVLLPDTFVCASAHDRTEFLWQEDFSRNSARGKICHSFGIHPQLPVFAEREFLESLVAEKRIQAIGECGFDLYSPEFRSRLDEQAKAWDFQLDIAVRTGLPLVIHCRKALDRIFADTKRLTRVRAVVFHGWPGSSREAKSFLERGVNAWFCVGKGLLRGDKSLADTVRALPPGRLLTETDAPYMQSRGEDYSVPADIAPVTERAASIAGMPLEEFASVVADSFRTVFGGFPAPL